MTVQIDPSTATCTITLNGTVHRSDIKEARITTDPDARMSVLHIPGASAHVTEDQVGHLLNFGAADERRHLFTDD